mmetsp:Transcript_146111/g.468652  ORF Transcript_146111/g.468652 Transcript_146111/m.468652 type:complete len:228 (+) Transcript_146111:917-1600(+)
MRAGVARQGPAGILRARRRPRRAIRGEGGRQAWASVPHRRPRSAPQRFFLARGLCRQRDPRRAHLLGGPGRVPGLAPKLGVAQGISADALGRETRRANGLRAPTNGPPGVRGRRDLALLACAPALPELERGYPKSGLLQDPAQVGAAGQAVGEGRARRPLRHAAGHPFRPRRPRRRRLQLPPARIRGGGAVGAGAFAAVEGRWGRAWGGLPVRTSTKAALESDDRAG